MRRNKVLVSHPNGSVLGSRRQFLGLGGAVFGATILAPLYPRSARAQSSGFDYYISPTGSDSNPGTQTNPWALTSINTKQSTYAGKRVGVLPGTYNCLALCGGSYTGSFSSPAFFIAGGSASAPTVIQSTTPRGAILDAGANASNNPNGQPLIGNVGSGCQYITIDGFEIKNCFNRAVSMGYQTGAYGGYSGPLSLGIVVQNCYVHAITNTLAGANTTGITIYSANGAIVQNNYLTDIADSTTRGDAIEFWTSQNSIAQFNTVIAAGPGMYAGIVNKNASNFNNSVCYNYVDLTLAAPISQGGIVMDSDGGGSTTDTAHHNIVISDYPVGAALINTGNFPASSNNQTWYNNTLIGIPNFATVGFYRMGAARTISFYNNIIQRNSTGYRGDVNTNTSAAALWDYNCYTASPQLGLSPDGTQNPPKVYTSIGSWAAALPSGCVGKDGHSLSALAAFVASGAGPSYYQLQAGSPCKGRGSSNGTTGGTPTDMGAWGNGTTQIGCSFAPGATPPVTPDAPTIISVS